jgi:hypothetical protein
MLSVAALAASAEAVPPAATKYGHLIMKQPRGCRPPALPPAARAPRAATPFSFDQFVSELLEMQRHVDAECLRGLKVDYQLEFGRRLHGKLARLGTL